MSIKTGDGIAIPTIDGRSYYFAEQSMFVLQFIRAICNANNMNDHERGNEID